MAVAGQDVTEAARKLRQGDEQQIRGVLAALRHGGRFVIIVAEEAIFPAVREALARGISPLPLHEVSLVTGDDVMRLFASPVIARDGIVVLHIGDDAAGAVEALNLHRDKLRRNPCRFVLWLDGAEVHRRFAREAPDCYSFRDAVALVEGRTAVAALPTRDRAQLKELRRSVSAAQRPEHLFALAHDFFDLDRPDEAHLALERGIAILSAKKKLSPEDRSRLANLHYYRAAWASPEERRNRVREALRILEPVRDQFEEQYTSILGRLRDAYGIEVGAAQAALSIAQRSGGAADSEHVTRQLMNLADALWQRDDVKGAREVLRQVSWPWWLDRRDASCKRSSRPTS